MTDLQALREALRQREQELAAVVASQAMSQQQEDDLKQVTTGSWVAPQSCHWAQNISRCTAYLAYKLFALSGKEAAMHALDTIANSSRSVIVERKQLCCVACRTKSMSHTCSCMP